MRRLRSTFVFAVLIILSLSQTNRNGSNMFFPIDGIRTMRKQSEMKKSRGSRHQAEIESYR